MLKPPSSLPARIVSTIVLFATSLTAIGCATSRLLPSPADVPVSLHGSVHGGQQPVTGASLQLYAAGQTGNASAATALLTSPVLSDANGNFDITGLYTCPAPNAQVYLAATGGNPGLPPGGNNPVLALVTALGDCSSLASTPTIALNEITTVAAAWALAPFSSSIANVGTSPTNMLGLAHAMQSARLLADSTNGNTPAATLPATATVESAKIITLANLFATCVNSNGGGFCAHLFLDAGGGNDTFEAAMSIARAPAVNVIPLFDDLPSYTAFAGSLTQPPNDWSLSIAYTGASLSSPTAVAIDATGNPWVTNVSGTLSAFSATGVPLWQSGVGGAGLDHSVALSIDPLSHIWVANMASGPLTNGLGSITAVTTSGRILSGATGFTAGNIDYPAATAIDPDGTVWVANLGSSTVTHLDFDGSPLSGANGFGGGVLAQPSALVVDSAHNAWIASRNTGSLVHMDATGVVLAQPACCGLPDSLALDTSGQLWIGDNVNSVVTRMSPAGIVLGTLSGNGLNRPKSIALDASSHAFITNNVGNTLSVFDANANPLSPNGIGLDANLRQPGGAAVDASGTVWVTSFGNNRLLAFIGMGAPTKTPVISQPQQP